jgi:hypothetical protein
MDVFERLGRAERFLVPTPNPLLGSYVAYITPRASPFPFAHPAPTPSRSNHKRFLFWLSHEDMESSTTPPHLGFLHSPSSLPGVAHLPPPTAPPTHRLSSVCCGFFPNSPLCGCLKVFLLMFPPSVSFHLVPSAPSVALPFPFFLSIPHFQQLSVHILLSSACPGVMFLDFGEAPSFSFLFPGRRGSTIICVFVHVLICWISVPSMRESVRPLCF